MVPESGRFIVSYMKLTAVGDDAPRPQARRCRRPPSAPAGPPPLSLQTGNPTIERLVRQLARVWIDFETRLHQVPIVAKLESGRFTRDDYKLLLAEPAPAGRRGRALDRAGRLTDGRRPLPAAQPLHHARARGAPRLRAAGAQLRRASAATSPTSAARRRTSAARRCRPGCSTGRARRTRSICWARCSSSRGWARSWPARWGALIREQLDLADDQVSFLLYHGGNDDRHLDKLEQALDAGAVDDRMVDRIVKTAKVTARLYCLQLEELGNV